MKAQTRWVPSLDLVHRINETVLAYTLERMKVLEALPENPIGIAHARFGDATALAAQNLPSPAFNSHVILRSRQAQLVRPLLDWSRLHGVESRFEISVADYDAEFGDELTREGFHSSQFHAALIGEPDGHVDAEPPPGLSVERVATPAQMENFLDAYVLGWGIPEAARRQFRDNVREWPRQPNWRLYLARVDGAPAAAAILFLHDGAGYFADAATVPNFRGQGLHAALLARRWRDAEAAGVELVCGGADAYSASHRNMERSGMRLLFLRMIWTSST